MGCSAWVGTVEVKSTTSLLSLEFALWGRLGKVIWGLKSTLIENFSEFLYLFLLGLDLCSSQCGLLTSSVGVTWELVRDAESERLSPKMP